MGTERSLCLWHRCTFSHSFSVALVDILDAFDLTENAKKIEEARDSAGNDMLKMMQIVFPITTQIQMDVIGKYGFPPDGDGKYSK